MANSKRWADLIGAVLLVGLVTLLTAYTPTRVGVWRTAPALLTLLLVPGYVVGLTLFPRKTNLSGLDRGLISLGYSVITVPLLGLIINVLPGGITPHSMAQGLWVWTGTWAIAAGLRRHTLGHQSFVPAWGSSGVTTATLMTVVSVGTVTGLGTLLSALHGSVPFTEFALLGPGGRLADYPRRVEPGGALNVVLVVRNVEGHPESYVIRSSACPADLRVPSLKSGEAWKQAWSCPGTVLSKVTALKLDLYRADGARPYRSLLLNFK